MALTRVVDYLIKVKLSVTGAMSRLLSDKLHDCLNVKDFGAKGDGITDDSAAIQAAILYAESLPQLLVHPYTPVRVHFPAGVYRHTKPLRITQPIKFTGDGVKIQAMAPFTPISIDLQAGGTANFNGQFIAVNGKMGADSGQGILRWGLSFSNGIMLDANDTAMSNLYFERFANAQIDCALQNSPTDALVVGPSCWGLGARGLSLENFSRYGIHFKDRSAVNGAVLGLRTWGNFKTGQAGILFDVGSACNGVTITGYIEKVDYGIIAAKSTGAISVNGVDFEQCTNRVLQAASDASDGKKVGPISFRNCFLHSIGAAKVYAENTYVSIERCTMYTGADDYETDAASTGFIDAIDNDHQAGYAGIVAGSNVRLSTTSGLVRENRNYMPTKVAGGAVIPVISNYQVKDAPLVETSSFRFSSTWDAEQGKHKQVSSWTICDYYPSTSLKRNMGVKLTTEGAFAFAPISDGDTACGLPGLKWTAVYAFNGVIQLSDMRHKSIREILEAEYSVGRTLSSRMLAYTWSDSNDTRTHFGCGAQDVIVVFDDNGLNAVDYGVVEYNKEADIYSVNYSQLYALCIAAIARDFYKVDNASHKVS